MNDNCEGPGEQLPSEPGATIQPAPPLPENASPEEKFEAKFHQLMDGFGAACAAGRVELALAIALDPDTQQPLIFTRGNNYELLQIMKWTYIRIRQQLWEELSL